MSRGKELVKNTAIVAVGKASTKFLSFFLLPFYTSVLSTADYGIADLFSTYVTLIVTIVLLQIEDAVFRFMVDARNSDEERKKVGSTTFFFGLSQIALFSVLFFVAKFLVTIPYLNFLWLNVIAVIFYNLQMQFTRGCGDNYGYAISGLFTTIVAIALNIFFILGLGMGAEGMLTAGILSSFSGAVFLFVRRRMWRDIRWRWFDKKLLKEMLAYSLPLVPNYLCWWIIGASDKTIVNRFLGIQHNGVLAVSQKFSTTYTAFYSIFNLTWTESAALHRYDKDSNEYYSYIIEQSFRLLAGVCIVILPGVSLFFPLLINDKFSMAYYQIPIYMLSAFIYSVIGIFSVVYIAYKKTGGIAKTSMIAAAVNLLVNVCLIRYIGLYASSVSSVVAYALMFFIRYFDIKKYAKIQVKRSAVIAVVCMFTVSMVVYYLNVFWLNLICLGIAIIFTVYLNRVLLTELKKMLLRKRA